MTLLETLGIDLPIIQAPMAGVSSPAMAAAVTNAGALGSIGVGATDAEGARRMIAAARERSKRPLKLTAYGVGSVIVLPGDQSHFHWAKSGEYITQVTAIGPLGLSYINPGDDPRNARVSPASEPEGEGHAQV